jgi:hypothetical protein
MNTGDVVAGAVGIAVSGLATLIVIWSFWIRETGRRLNRIVIWFWPIKLDTQNALVRGGAAAGGGMTVACAGLFVGGLMRHNPPPAVAAVAVGAFLTTLLLMTTITLFNWPKLLVPPLYKNDKGLIALRLEEHRRKNMVNPSKED